MGIAKINSREEEERLQVTLSFTSTKKGNFFVDTEITPAFCTHCHKQVDGFFHYTGSRYGQVGELDCSHCGEKIYCADPDYVRYLLWMSTKAYYNRFIYTEEQFDQKYVKTEIDFSQIYMLSKEIFAKIKEITGYDVFENDEENKDISLKEVISILCLRAGLDEHNLPASGFISDDRFPAMPVLIQKWFSLLERLHVIGMKDDITR